MHNNYLLELMHELEFVPSGWFPWYKYSSWCQFQDFNSLKMAGKIPEYLTIASHKPIWAGTGWLQHTTEYETLGI